MNSQSSWFQGSSWAMNSKYVPIGSSYWCMVRGIPQKKVKKTFFFPPWDEGCSVNHICINQMWLTKCASHHSCRHPWRLKGGRLNLPRQMNQAQSHHPLPADLCSVEHERHRCLMLFGIGIPRNPALWMDLVRAIAHPVTIVHWLSAKSPRKLYH